MRPSRHGRYRRSVDAAELAALDPASVDATLDDPGRLSVTQRVIAVQWPRPELQTMLDELAGVVRVPFTAATLLDGSEQHFLATNGGPVASCSRETSHCQYVIATGRFLAIADTQASPLWSRLHRQMLGRKPLQAYLGFPLRVLDQTIGAVCAVDVVRHDWSTDDQFAVYDTARRAGLLLERGL